MSDPTTERLRSSLDPDAQRAVLALDPHALNGSGSDLRATLDLFAVDVIKGMAMDAVEKANSGHPGGPCSSVDFAYVLFTRHLRCSTNASWIDRDRFVLSGGHMSMLLYSLLYMQGHATREDLEQFRQLGSRTQGHPVFRFLPGVECTTGPLGQGFASGVGMALAEKYLRSVFGPDLVDHHTYVLATDGDIQEGVCREAASLAGHLGLDRLIVFYDSNDIQLASPVKDTMTEDVSQGFRAMGWHVLDLPDGHDHRALDGAIRAARAETRRPSIIIGKTVIARGTKKAGLVETHGAPLGKETILDYKKRRQHPEDRCIWTPEIVRELFRFQLEAGDREHATWIERANQTRREKPDLMQLFDRSFALSGEDEAAGRIAKALDGLEFPPGKAVATRNAGGSAMAALKDVLPHLIGGSADLANSTKTDTFEKAVGYFPGALQAGTASGRGLHYGVREHAMGSITNGMALHGGLLPYSGTFLAFSDYMRPAIRLAAISHLPCIFIFTHDSIFLGEDGETHQPVEQIEALRLIPRLKVFRPGDAYETRAVWDHIARHASDEKPEPSVLILSRQNLPVLPEARDRARSEIDRGAYVVLGEGSPAPDLQLIATGSELHLALAAGRELATRHKRHVRVISMPCQELFLRLPPEERDRIFLPTAAPVVVIEAGVGKGWKSIAGELATVISVDTYGESAPYEELMRKHGFTVEKLVPRLDRVIRDHTHALADRITRDTEWLRAHGQDMVTRPF